MFVAGAIGAEMVGGWYLEQLGSANPVFVSIQTIGEVVEMAGVLGVRLVISSRDVADSGRANDGDLSPPAWHGSCRAFGRCHPPGAN